MGQYLLKQGATDSRQACTSLREEGASRKPEPHPGFKEKHVAKAHQQDTGATHGVVQSTKQLPRAAATQNYEPAGTHTVAPTTGTTEKGLQERAHAVAKDE